MAIKAAVSVPVITGVDATCMDSAGWTIDHAYRGDASNTDKEAGTVAKFGTGSVFKFTIPVAK